MKNISFYQPATTIETDFQYSLENKISYYHFAHFLVMLPFDRFYSQVILFSLVVHTLIHLNWQKLHLVLMQTPVMLSSIFFLTAAGLIWSREKTDGLKELEYQSAILLFPIIFSSTRFIIQGHKKKLLLLFSITCIITTLYLFADAIHIILYNKLSLRSLFSPAFINHHFCEPIGIHATYFSMYVSLSIAVLAYYFATEKNKRGRFLYAIGLLILLAGLLQLASKSVLVATTIFIYCGLLFFLKRSKKNLLLLPAVLVVSAIGFFTLTRVTTFQKRYIEGIKEDLTDSLSYHEIAEPRIVRWRSALPLITQSPLIGHGSGSEKQLLMEKYFENKLYNSYLHELNAHNQYLSLLIKNGVIGLFLFLFTLYTGFAAAWHRGDFIFAAFMILISIVSLSENILDVNKGIFFYSFFFSFFYVAGKKLKHAALPGKKKDARLTTSPKEKIYTDSINLTE